MTKISVPIYIESRYKVNRKRIKETVSNVIKAQGIGTPVEVSVAVVGNRKMKELNKKYRNIDAPTNVLSFPQGESFGGNPDKLVKDLSDNVVTDQLKVPNDKLYLGDVVISYPMVIEEAARYNKLVDDWTCELVEHGLMHLLGIHHK